MLRGSMERSQLRDMAPLLPKTNKDFLNRINFLINENISNDRFGITELSDKLGVSNSYLNRLLKNNIGISAGKLIRNMRMELAYKLITESEIPVKNIGMQVGYLQQSNFTRAFVNTYQQSPSSFRLNQEKKEFSKINWQGELSKQGLTKVKDFLLKNEQLAKGIEELCHQIENPNYKISEFVDSCCLSSSQLNRIFTKQLNITTSLFIRYLKVSYVSYKLCCEDENITELIYGTNFFDLSYFNKCFKGIHGITPSAYRKLHLRKQKDCFYMGILSMLKNDK